MDILAKLPNHVADLIVKKIPKNDLNNLLRVAHHLHGYSEKDLKQRLHLLRRSCFNHLTEETQVYAKTDQRKNVTTHFLSKKNQTKGRLYVTIKQILDILVMDDRKPFLIPEMVDKLKESPVWDTFHEHDDVLKDYLWKCILLTVRSNKIHMCKCYIGVGTESRPGDGLTDVTSETFVKDRLYTGQRAKLQNETPFTREKLEYVMFPLCSTDYTEITSQIEYFKTCVSDNAQIYWTILGNILQMYGGPESLYCAFQWKTQKQMLTQKKDTEDGLNKEKRNDNWYVNYCHKSEQCMWKMNTGFIVSMEPGKVFSKSNVEELRRVVKKYTRTGKFPILAVKDLHYGHPLNNDIEGNRYRPEYEGYQKKDAFVMKEELEDNILANQKMNLTYMLQSFLVRREWCLAAIRDMTTNKRIKDGEDKRKKYLQKVKENGGKPIRKAVKRKSPTPHTPNFEPCLQEPMSPVRVTTVEVILENQVEENSQTSSSSSRSSPTSISITSSSGDEGVTTRSKSQSSGESVEKRVKQASK